MSLKNQRALQYKDLRLWSVYRGGPVDILRDIHLVVMIVVGILTIISHFKSIK